MEIKKRRRILYIFAALFLFYAIINGSFSIYREIKGDSISLNISSPTGTVAVTFNPNGGTIPQQDATRSVQSGTAVGTLPTSATNTDHVFDGWYTDPTDGTKISSETIVTGTTVTYYAHWTKIVCKKAASGTLHTETCYSSGACINVGYEENDVITYGTIPTSNSPIVGDAYDCDVNDDNVWDPVTERFYYVRSYGGVTQNVNSVLVHFTSFDKDGQMFSSFDRENYSYDEALTHLPTATKFGWDNPSLIMMDGKPTRFVSREDLSAACGSNYNLSTCQFYLENSRFQSETLGRAGIWIVEEGTTKYRIHTHTLTVEIPKAEDSKNTVRPTIEIPSKTIEGFVTTNVYTITFNPTDGDLDDPNESSRNIAEGGVIGTLPTASLENYVLDGWYTAASGGTKISESTLVTADITYYAHWIPAIEITFDANGGTVSPSSKEIATGAEIGELPTPEYTDRIFVGWFTESEDGTEVTENTVFNQTTIIYAHWELSNDYVFYIPGQCKFTSEGIEDGPDGECISTVNPTDEDIDYTVGELSTKKYIDTLVGLYDSTNHSKDYEIHFEVVEFNPSNNTSQATFVNTKKENGNTYPGLVVRRNTTKNYAEISSRVTSNDNVYIPFEPGGLHTLSVYRIDNEIYYSLNGGDKIFVNNLEAFDPEFALTTWFGAAPKDSSANTAQRYLTGTLANMYIKVKDRVPKATITFDPNYQGSSTFTQKFILNQPLGELPTTTQTGYTFLGWFTESSEGTQIDENTIATDGVTYYAHWHENITITLHANGGTGVPNSITVPYNTPIGTIDTPTKTNSAFEGWYQDPNFEVAVTEQTALTADADFYAKWNDGVTITYNPKGGTVDPTSVTIAQGVAIGSLPTPEKTGFTFGGWFTDDGTFEDEVTEQRTFNSSTEIFAKWIENVTVTFNPNDGTVDPTSVSFPSGTAIGSLPTPEKPGFDFAGWFTDDGTFEDEVTEQTTFNSSTQIYAKWEELLIITVNFDANGGTVSETSITMTPGDEIGTLPIPSKDPSRTNYIFVGWYLDDGTFENEVTEDTVLYANTNLIARWVDDTYVACIGTACYSTLQNAVNAASSTKTTVKVITDISNADTTTIPSGSWVELDVGSHTITITTNGKNVFTNEGTLDIINGNLTSSKGYVVYNKTGAILNVSGGILTYNNASQTEFKVIENAGGTVNITGGTLTCNSQAAVINVKPSGTLNISGGTIRGTNSTKKGQAVYNEGGVVTISGDARLENVSSADSTNGRAALTNASGTVNILGGTIISAKNAGVSNKGTLVIGTDDGTISTTSPVIQGDTYGIEFVQGTVTIYDGIFKGKYSSAGNRAISNENNVSHGTHSTYEILHDTETIDNVQYDVAYIHDDSVVIPDPAEIVEFDTIPTAMRTYFNSVDTWNNGQDDTNYSSFTSAMETNLSNNNCVYYQNDSTGTEYGSVYCDQPNKYDTGATGDINVYEYNETTEETTAVTYVFNDNGKLYNFIPNKVYYWESATDSSINGYVRPTGERRLITIPGTNRQVRNVRDLGGLPVDTDGDGTIDGTIKYQKLYRGEKIWGTNRDGVTASQFEQLGIYNEFDLRKQGSEIVASEEDILDNYIPYEIVHYKIDYTEFESNYLLARDAAIELMQRVVEGDDDYAIFFHCRIGADRTGTLAYILEGLLGVPTEYRYQDYELTTFFGLRDRTRYYYRKDSTNDSYKFLYMKKAIRHATPNNNELTGEENVMDWFLLGGNSTSECNDITALINQFRVKMIDFNDDDEPGDSNG